MKIERIADAKAEAISLDEARRQCKILDANSDDDLREAIEAARNSVEIVTRNPVVECEYVFYCDSFQSFFEIHKPIVSITSFEYKTEENTGDYNGSLTGSDYHMNTGQGLITLNNNVMSDLFSQSNAIKITARAGQPNIGAIPGNVKMAMKLMIGHWYNNREAVVIGTISAPLPIGVSDLLDPHRIARL